MAHISVVICAHNPRPERLRRTLDSLEGQSLSRLRWELLVVDNASDASVADGYDLTWHGRARHIREEKLGLTPARLRGIAETNGELVVFVDDDNVLAPTFLEEASHIWRRYPYLGVFGSGDIVPEFEIDPPSEIRPHLNLLALRTITQAQWSNNVGDFDSTPWGAGLCISRQVADTYGLLVHRLGPEVIAVLGRRGRALYSGEDDVFSWVAVSLGLGFGVFPSLQLTHLIAADRLNRQYFLRLIYDHAFSQAVRQFVFEGTHPCRIDGFRYAHLLLHGVRNGRFSMQCQWAWSRGTESAARFIADRNLKPVDLRDLADVDRATDRLGMAARFMSS